jgi:hypothetical protein
MEGRWRVEKIGEGTESTEYKNKKKHKLGIRKQMNPEGTWCRGGAKSAVVCQMSCLSVCLSVYPCNLAVTSPPRETSCFLVHNSVTVSILCAKSEEPTKCENVPLHSALSNSAHLQTFTHGAANLTAKYFYISQLGNFTPVLMVNCSCRLSASSFAFFYKALKTRTKWGFCRPHIFCLWISFLVCIIRLKLKISSITSHQWWMHCWNVAIPCAKNTSALKSQEHEVGNSDLW